MAQILKEKFDINLATQKFILQMCWAQHDGQWFLKSKRELGIQKANDLNKKVIFSMGKIEAKHIMNALGVKKGTLRTIPEVFKMMNTFMDVIIPKIMKFRFMVHSDKEGDGVIKKCFIWEEVKKSKKENEYTCACIHRHLGWLNALGIEGEILAIKRFPDGDNECILKFIINDSNN